MGDFNDGEFFGCQEFFCFFDSCLDDITIWGQSGGLFEEAGEVIRTHVDRSGDSGYCQVRFQLILDKFERAHQLFSWKSARGRLRTHGNPAIFAQQVNGQCGRQGLTVHLVARTPGP